MARRFRFRLDTVERLRRQVRDVQQRVVADAVQAVARVDIRKTRWINDLMGVLESGREVRRQGPMDVGSLRRHQLYRVWLHRMLDVTATELLDRNRELDDERSKLAEASKQLKVIEKLREKRWHRYQVEVKREEQSASDEAAVQMFSRRVSRSVSEVLAK